MSELVLKHFFLNILHPVCVFLRYSTSTYCLFRTCPCGKTKKTVKCGNPVGCTETCDKPLNCGEHKCKSLCHEGSCDECEVIHQQTCFCPRIKPREIQCGKVEQSEVKIGGFSCQEECQKIIECGNHRCSKPCHPGKNYAVRHRTQCCKENCLRRCFFSHT